MTSTAPPVPASVPQMQEYANISLGSTSKDAQGRFRMNSNGFGWKSQNGKSIGVVRSDLESATFLPMGGTEYLIRVGLRGGGVLKFGGFKRGDYESLAPYMKDHYNCTLLMKELSTKGWNWGELDVKEGPATFTVDGLTAFELPLHDVAQCSLKRQNDLAIEFRQDAVLEAGEEQFVEIKFVISNTQPVSATTDADELTSALTPAARLRQKVLSGASIGENTGSPILSLPQLQFLTPRGRYDVEFFASYCRMRGKTFEYRVSYDDCTGVFQLPQNDDKFVLFVLTMDPPVRQGQVSYPQVVMKFNRKDYSKYALQWSEDPNSMEVELQQGVRKLREARRQDCAAQDPPVLLTDDLQADQDEAATVVETRSMEMAAVAFSALTKKRITVPGSFRDVHGQPGIACSIKTSPGLLYVLEKSLFFLPKPSVYIRFVDVSHVEFARVAAGEMGPSVTHSRNFDLRVTLKNGGAHAFSSIAKEQYSSLFGFLSGKNIRIKGTRDAFAQPKRQGFSEETMAVLEEGGDTDSEDEEFAPEAMDAVPEEFQEDYSSEEEENPRKRPLTPEEDAEAKRGKTE